jgi:hypothetical protein
MAFDGGLFVNRRWEHAFKGELTEYLEAVDEAVLNAARFALTNVTQELKERLRSQVVRAGLGKEGAGEGKGSGRSLASAVRVEQYPKTGLARNPAALLYVQPSAVRIYEAFEDGATITSSSGRYLTIPIPGSPADRKNFGDKPRGQSVLDAIRARGIEIGFVPARNGRPAMLIAQSVRVRDGGRGAKQLGAAKRTKSGAFAKGAASVPLFFLVPKAQMPKKLNMRAEFERAAREFLDMFAREFDGQLGRISNRTVVI